MCLGHQENMRLQQRFSIIGFTTKHIVELNQSPQKDAKQYIYIFK